jgi:pimeloyl-ACP methyl ester carboxylesterase
VRRIGLLVAATAVVSVLRADGPQDNLADKVRPIPPPGIAVPPEKRQALETAVEALAKDIAKLREQLAKKPLLLALLPDVQIYYNAVHYALRYDEFYRPQEIEVAFHLLEEGRKRAELLAKGQAPWVFRPGLVVRGYVSQIDGSVQPYGLVIPASYRPGTATRHRLDIWFHGRGEKLTELNFINEREHSPGPFTPQDAFVLHPYGRYCNANHFAGEMDAFEALANVRRYYPIDPNRLTIRGFSMGGAACWHFAVHHAGLWAAAAPGAGFAETPEFLRIFQKETLKPTDYERKLWHLYDATDYAVNLYQCPTLAYSGEKDVQKQAADIMARALAAEGITLAHLVGRGMGHQYDPASKQEIERRLGSIVARGRNPTPRRIRFTTWTLRYNHMLWVTVDGLEQHWKRARVEAEMVGPSVVHVKTSNVEGLTLSMPAGLCPLDLTGRPQVVLDGAPLKAPPVLSDRSWVAHFRKTPDGWTVVPSADDGTLRKRHGLQGPIDDAFMGRFLMVRPSGKPLNDKVGRWTAAEMRHASAQWRKQFRGEAPIKDDEQVSAADIASSNLILWGDPHSNKLLAKIAARLPIVWDQEGIRLGPQHYTSDHHVLVLICPNPLNPKRYVVLNSGFTFREYDYLNNARQVPKLPDWAVLNVDEPANARRPAGIVTAGFFNEHWRLAK